MSEASIVQRFFPDVDPRLGAFGLLGLPAGPCDDAQVAAALKARLDKLISHPLGHTPEAGEVRLALQIAAAQLRDPAQRAELIAKLPPATPVQRAAPTIRRSPMSAAFEDVALQVIVHSGGWNQDAKRRLGSIAHAYGLGPADLKAAVLAVARRRGAPRRPSAVRAASGHTAANAVPLDSALDAEQSRLRWALPIATVVLLLATVIIGVRLDRLVSGSRPRRAPVVTTAQGPMSAGNTTKQASGADQQSVEAPEVAQEVPPPPTVQQPIETESDPEALGRAIIAQVRTASAQLANDPRSALASYQEAIKKLGVSWTTLDKDTLTAVGADVAEFVFASSRRDRASGRTALDAILLPVEKAAGAERTTNAQELRVVVWSTGMLQRLRRDRSLPEVFGGTIDATLRRLANERRVPAEQSFWRGAGFALDSLGHRLLPREADAGSHDEIIEAWKEWIACCEAFAQSEVPLVGKTLMLDMVEAILHGKPDPALDKLTSDVLNVLLAAIEWRDEAVAGTRLIAWFDDTSLPTERLSVVANRLVLIAAVPGLNQSMMVQVNAGGAMRTSLRDQWATLLGQPASRDTQAAVSLWLDQARAMLAIPLSESDSNAALLRAVGLSRLNEAAAHRWKQESSAADRAADSARLDSINASLHQPSAQEIAAADPGILTWPGRDRDGDWAKRYLASMNSSEQRIELLNELRNSNGPTGPADADVLCEAACFGTPIEVRRLAQTVVRERSESLVVVNGLLEEIPRAARSPGVSDMIDAVTGHAPPPLDDARWRPELRRLLVEHTLRLIAKARDARTDQLAHMLNESYRARAGLSASASNSTSVRTTRSAPPKPGELPPADAVQRENAPSGPEVAAAELWEAWASLGRRYAEGGWTFVSMDELERRRAGRASLAEGPLQLFAAEQASSVEAMAYVVAAERPSRAILAADIVKQMATKRREAQHVFNQVEAAEVAALRLWIIRFGEDGGNTP